MKPFTWQSLQHTVRDRWRYVLSVFAGLCVIAGLLIVFVVSQGQPGLPALMLAGLGAAVVAPMLSLIGRDPCQRVPRVRQITTTIAQIAAGDLEARALARGPGDIGALSRAVNDMAERLARQSRKRNREPRPVCRPCFTS